MQYLLQMLHLSCQVQRLPGYQAPQSLSVIRVGSEMSRFQGPSVWNSIDEDIKLSSLSLFKKKMKQLFIKDY